MSAATKPRVTAGGQITKGFGSVKGEKSPQPQTRQQGSSSARQQADSSPSVKPAKSSVISEPVRKATFKMPQSQFDRFEELYEEFRVEEWKKRKRKLKKLTFTGYVFKHGLNPEQIRKELVA